MSTDLTITSDQKAWTQTQKAALQQLGVEGASEGDLEVFFHQAQRTGLDPFKRELYMIGRKQKIWNPQTKQETWETRHTIQTGIDGFYKIASRAANATGESWGITETLWCGTDGQWTDVWLAQGPPAAAKVTLEKGSSKFVTVALTSEYMADKSPMWRKMPSRMIAKCAEALAIRKAFPEDTSGLYTSEEMHQADNQQPTAEAPQEAKPDPIEQSLRDAWNDPERLQKAVKFLSREGHPLLDKARQRLEELTATAPAEGDDVEDAEIVESES